MWQRFTEQARKSIFYAQEEAGRAGETVVTPNHLLLGVLREEQGPVVRILRTIGVDPLAVRSAIEQLMPSGDHKPGVDMQLSPGAKLVIDLAYGEASRLHFRTIGPELLLLGIIREGKADAAKTLVDAGATVDRTRAGILVYHSGGITAVGDGEESTWPPPPTSQPNSIDSLVTMKELEIDAGRANLRIARRLLFTSQCLYAGYIASIVIALALNSRSVPTMILTWANRAVAGGLIATLLSVSYFCNRSHWRTPPRDLEGAGILWKALGLMALVAITYFWISA